MSNNKKSNYFWGPVCIIGLFTAVIGTTYTNINGLNGRFFIAMAVSMAVMITLSQIVIMFMERISLGFKILFVLMIIISSSLAINTMESKEITGKDKRLQSDYLLQKYTKEFDKLDSDYNLANEKLNKYIDLQMGSSYNWNDGAKATRIERDSLFAQKTRAQFKVETREKELLKKGTVTQEAFINVFTYLLSFLNFSEKAVEIFTSILFSIINDGAIPIFSYGLTCIYGDKIMIRDRKRKNGNRNNGNNSLSPVDKVSLLVRKIVGKKSENFGMEDEILSESSYRGKRVSRRAHEIKRMNRNLTNEDIGKIVGLEIRGKAYAANYISEILNGKY